jgi:hypothetical protein
MDQLKNDKAVKMHPHFNTPMRMAVLGILLFSAVHAQNATVNEKDRSPANIFLNGSPMRDAAIGPAPERSPSKAKAFFLSLVLPGAGEYYAGSQKTGWFFLGNEIALWCGYGAFRTYGDWKKEDYRLFAAVHAGVDLSGKGHAYFVDVENYSNLLIFNDAKLQQRSPQAMYPEDKIHSWNWDSDASRLRFKSLRLSSDRAYSRSLIVVGAIVVNHIVSGIDAIRVAKKKERLGLQVGIRDSGKNGISMTLTMAF